VGAVTHLSTNTDRSDCTEALDPVEAVFFPPSAGAEEGITQNYVAPPWGMPSLSPSSQAKLRPSWTSTDSTQP